MGHYDDCRVSESAVQTKDLVTEIQILELLIELMEKGGEITLYTEMDDKYWPIVYHMRDNNDNRILTESYGYKQLTLMINKEAIDNEIYSMLAKKLLGE